MKRTVAWRLAASMLAIAAAGAVQAGAPGREGAAGSYLQARHAALESDFELAARHYAEAIDRDPGNPVLMESAVSAHLNAGEADRAAEVARALDRDGETSQIATMAILVERASAGDWHAILEAQDEGRAVGPLVDALTRGWALIGAGESEAGLAVFRQLSASENLGRFGRLHEALARAALGDWAGAERTFAGRDEAGQKVRAPVRLTRRTALLRAVVLNRLGRDDHALALLDHLFGGRADPGARELRAHLVAGEPVAYHGPLDAEQGMAEAFHTVAAVLRGDAAHGYVLLYARAAVALRPDHGDAQMLSASLLGGLRRHREAGELYAKVPPDHPAYVHAQIGLASALRAQGRGVEAISALEALEAEMGGAPRIRTALGDALRAEGRHGEAVAAYDGALGAYRDASQAPWRLHYARAVSRDRMGDWSGARADLDRALEIEPDQPRVLHLRGAAMLERGEPLAQALAVLERARAAAPEDGAVEGTLGWTLHRMGRVAEAVEHLERAAVLEPLDPVLNDRLGDALWTAGRQREARFQWRRALVLDPEATTAALLRLKIAHGLDAVPGAEEAPVALAADR